jgi:hypothetical protein
MVSPCRTSIALASLFALTLAQDDQRICAWYRSRFGTVRDGLYIDGGTRFSTDWQDGNWSTATPTQDYPSGVLHAFNFSTSFEGNEPVDLNSILTSLPLTAGGTYNAPDYSQGAMLTSNFELYTYG